jgi:hypothetical protein
MRIKHAVPVIVSLLVVAATARAVDSPWPKFRQNQRNTGATPYSGPGTPAVKWSFQADDGIACSPSIGVDGTLYVGAGWYFQGTTDSSLYALNRDGSLKWKYKTGGGVFSSPAIGPDGTVSIGSYDGNLYAVRDAGSEGVAEWVFPTGGAVDGSATVEGNGTIYFGCRDSTIYALNPDGSLQWSYPTSVGIESSPHHR